MHMNSIVSSYTREIKRICCHYRKIQNVIAMKALSSIPKIPKKKKKENKKNSNKNIKTETVNLKTRTGLQLNLIPLKRNQREIIFCGLKLSFLFIAVIVIGCGFCHSFYSIP